jgi:hypothetical protein
MPLFSVRRINTQYLTDCLRQKTLLKDPIVTRFIEQTKAGTSAFNNGQYARSVVIGIIAIEQLNLEGWMDWRSATDCICSVSVNQQLA